MRRPPPLRPLRSLRATGSALAACLALVGCRADAAPSRGPGYQIVGRYPHDSTAYTQGLVYEGGALYESTGQYGRSTVRRVELESGAVQQSVSLSSDRFGEGLALLDGRLYQLTWKSGIAYVYDATTLAPIDSIRYEGEGWGLTTDGSSLIMSDGTSRLRFLDPATFEVLRTLDVRFSSQSPVRSLNELEYVDGELFANVYQSDWILRIDPATGVVKDVVDLVGIMPGHDAASTDEFVLNGIAYDRATGHLLVTGKQWPLLFRIALDRRPGGPSTH